MIEKKEEEIKALTGKLATAFALRRSSITLPAEKDIRT